MEPSKLETLPQDTADEWRGSRTQGPVPSFAGATHRAAFRTVISGRAFGSRGSCSTRRAGLALLSPFSFGSLQGKAGVWVPGADQASKVLA